MVDGGELTAGIPGTPTEIANGTLAFNTSGALQTQTILASSADFINAVPAQVIDFNFGDDITSGGTGIAGTTQYGSASAVTALNVDGHASGNVTDLAISESGMIEGVFDNGERLVLAQLALAEFGSDHGLRRAGDGLYEVTNESGIAMVDVAGQGGRGAISAGSVEQSNVDLGDELVTLIAYQRAFQANAKTVTTADEMLAEITNLKR